MQTLTHAVTISYNEIFSIDQINIQEISSPNGELYSKLNWEDMFFHGIPGTPQLPIKYIRLQVPLSAHDFTANISNIELGYSIKIPHRLYPVQEDLPINRYDSASFTAPDLNLYYQSPINPEVHIIDSSVIEGAYHIVTLSVSPVTYNSDESIINVYQSYTVELSFNTDSKDSGNQYTIPGEPFIKVDAVVDSNIVSNSIPKSTIKAGGNIDSKMYLIVSERKLLNALEELAVWKRQKGYRVVLKAIEDIYASSDYKVGATSEIVDEAASLREFLKVQYLNNGSYFCLLVGDDKTKIPIRKVYYKEYEKDAPQEYYSNPNGECYIPTDNYFSDFQTVWNLKKDSSGIYTQSAPSSYTPNIYIGRLLCHTASGISSYISKLITYEANPGNGNMSYLDKARYFVQYDGRYVYQNCVNNLKTFNDIETYLDIAISDATKFGTPTGEFAISQIANSGFISMMGHGEPGTIACSGRMKHSYVWEYISALDYYKSDIDDNNNVTIHGQSNIRNDCKNNGLELLNNINRPNIMYSLGCNTSPFDTYETSTGLLFNLPHTIASSFTTGGRYGGVAFLGNTRQGYWSSSSSLEQLFLSSISDYRKIGIAESMSKYQFHSNSKVKNEHHLIGDPEFEMWLTMPKTLDVQVIWQPNNILVSGKDINGCKIILYDGSRYNIVECSKQSYVIPYPGGLSLNNNSYVLSIWKTGYLPIISLIGNSQVLTNDTKSFIVLDAELGCGESPCELTSANNYEIGENTNINIKALKSIKCGDNFIVSNGGYASLSCYNSISIGAATVKDGGSIELNAKDVILSPGFNVELGGEMRIK